MKEETLQCVFRRLSPRFPRLAAWQAGRIFTKPDRYPIPSREIEYSRGARTGRSRQGLWLTHWGDDLRPRVLLLHGWSGRGTQLGAFAAPLVERGYAVTAVDGPAHGQSPGTRTNPREFVEALQALDVEFGPFEAIIAHSFGAGCTVWALTLGVRCRTLIYVASIACFDDVIDRFGAWIQLAPPALEALHERVRRSIRRREPLNVAKMMATLNQRVLIVHDRDDKDVAYSEVARITAEAPSCAVMTTEGLGHQRILRDPAVVARVVDFVAGGEKPNA